jgi:hypothetical protein
MAPMKGQTQIAQGGGFGEKVEQRLKQLLQGF